MDSACGVSQSSVERMLIILQTERKELARFLVDEEITPSELIHHLVTANVITKTHTMAILRRDQTTLDRYTCLLNSVETVIATSISNGSNDVAVLVKNFISTLLDCSLHRIAYRLHPELTDSYASDTECSSVNAPCDAPHFYSYSEYPNETLDPSSNPHYSSRSTENGAVSFMPTPPSSSSVAATGPSSDSNTSYNTTSSGDSASPHMRPSESYPSFGDLAAAPLNGVRASASDGNIANKLAEADMEIVVQYNKKVFGPMDHEASDEEIYRNSSNPRGLVFLANYSFFKNTDHKYREGSEVDVKNLHSLFEKMGYVVPTVHEDLNKGDTLLALKKFRDDERHERVHSCVVIIMSHGKDDGSFYTADGLYITTQDVLELFSNRGCNALIDKPKFFILQYCRGDRKDMGVPPMRLVARSLGRVTQTDSVSMGCTRAFINKPTFADMLVVYSTVEGYVSYRHPQHGTWLIKALCQVFMKYACKNNIDQLLKKVSKLVSERESEDGKKQSCEIRLISFNKDFYFNPTITFDDTRATFPSLDNLASALPSGYDSSPQLTPRGYLIPNDASRWSLSSQSLSNYETLDAFHNSSGNSSVENFPAGTLAHRSGGDFTPVDLRQSVSHGDVNHLLSHHLHPFNRTGARPRVKSGGSRRNSLSGSPRPLSNGDPVQLHPRLLIGSSAKRRSDPHEPFLNFFQPSLVETNNGSVLNGMESPAGHLGSGDVDTQLGATLDSVDSRVGSDTPSAGRATPTLHHTPGGGAGRSESSLARESSLDLEVLREGGESMAFDDKLSFLPTFSGEDVVSKKPTSSRRRSRERFLDGAPSDETSGAPRPGERHGMSPVVPELSYREYRREKSMELNGRSNSAAEFPVCSIKRHLSVDSDREMLTSIHKVKTFLQVNEGEHLIPQVELLTDYMNQRKDACKKRKKESQSQE